MLPNFANPLPRSPTAALMCLDPDHEQEAEDTSAPRGCIFRLRLERAVDPGESPGRPVFRPDDAVEKRCSWFSDWIQSCAKECVVRICLQKCARTRTKNQLRRLCELGGPLRRPRLLRGRRLRRPRGALRRQLHPYPVGSFPIFDEFLQNVARFRLYRHRSLQVNTRFSAFSKSTRLSN